MKAADISDAQLLALIPSIKSRVNAASLWTLQEALPQYPPKVVQAKLKSMVKRKLLTGCACGCRGDFRVIS